MSHGSVLSDVEALAGHLVTEAAALIRSQFATALRVTYKGDGLSQPVTELDLAIEERIRAAVRKAFPDHGIIGEELPDDPGASGWTWVVDPIDGTRNLILGIPVVACSIGVLHHGRPVAGAVALPMSEVVVSARLGAGTRWNGAPVTVSDRDLAGSIAVYSHDTYCSLGVRDDDPTVLGESRWFGSTAWELAMIAGGRLDHGVFPSTAIWDVAGGLALVREAGGAVLRPRADGAWAPFTTFGDLAGARRWAVPLVCGGRSAEQAAGHVGDRCAVA